MEHCISRYDTFLSTLSVQIPPLFPCRFPDPDRGDFHFCAYIDPGSDKTVYGALQKKCPKRTIWCITDKIGCGRRPLPRPSTLPGNFPGNLIIYRYITRYKVEKISPSKTTSHCFRILGVWQSLDIPVTNSSEAEYQGRGKLHGVPNDYWETCMVLLIPHKGREGKEKGRE